MTQRVFSLITATLFSLIALLRGKIARDNKPNPANPEGYHHVSDRYLPAA